MTEMTMPTYSYKNQQLPANWNPPADAEELDFYGCSFVNMPTVWPASLKSLRLDTCTCNEVVSWTLPDTVEDLQLGFQKLCPATFPSGLRTLTLRKLKVETPPLLPSGLRQLRVMRGINRQPATLPPNLEYLYLYNTYWFEIPGPLPASLQLVKLEEQYLENYPVGTHPEFTVSHCEDCAFGDRMADDEGEDADSVS
jgi:hypothetical protein